jgi:hypothetical protein
MITAFEKGCAPLSAVFSNNALCGQGFIGFIDHTRFYTTSYLPGASNDVHIIGRAIPQSQ